jgi:hypothetical protein
MLFRQSVQMMTLYLRLMIYGVHLRRASLTVEFSSRQTRNSYSLREFVMGPMMSDSFVDRDKTRSLREFVMVSEGPMMSDSLCLYIPLITVVPAGVAHTPFPNTSNTTK